MPLVAMRASVREVLPWSWVLEEGIKKGQIFLSGKLGLTYDVCENTYLEVYVSMIAFIEGRLPTFLTSFAFRCSAINLVGSTTGIVAARDPENDADIEMAQCFISSLLESR